jgi:hypothetical protein
MLRSTWFLVAFIILGAVISVSLAPKCHATRSTYVNGQMVHLCVFESPMFTERY